MANAKAFGDRIRERRDRDRAAQVVRGEVKAYLAENPGATKAQAHEDIEKRIRAKNAGASPAWLELLLKFLPLILKIFGL